MDNIVITAASRVTEADRQTTRLGARFGRLDLPSQLALLAAEQLAVNFDLWARDQIAVCLAARGGSLSTDVEFWAGRTTPAGPSPTLFAYTLPSAAIGEIAIRHRLTGPGLCLVGGGADVLAAAADMLQRGEAAACVCVYIEVISPAAAILIQTAPVATAMAIFLQRGGRDQYPVGLEFDRDMPYFYDKFQA